MKPTVSTPRKLIIDQKVNCPAAAGSFISATAHGNRMKMVPSAAAMPKKITMGRYWSRNAVIESSGVRWRRLSVQFGGLAKVGSVSDCAAS